MIAGSAVSSDTKIQIWKQFTTYILPATTVALLCHPIQRYKFESNSQRLTIVVSIFVGCVIRYKDTNLKAIHNDYQGRRHRHGAVSSDTKIQIWKQFTTYYNLFALLSLLCHPIQRYKFESNSQRRSPHCTGTKCCVIRYKDTNLKAIHNTTARRHRATCAVSSDTKIQIWKQFTTEYPASTVE